MPLSSGAQVCGRVISFSFLFVSSFNNYGEWYVKSYSSLIEVVIESVVSRV